MAASSFGGTPLQIVSFPPTLVIDARELPDYTPMRNPMIAHSESFMEKVFTIY